MPLARYPSYRAASNRFQGIDPTLTYDFVYLKQQYVSTRISLKSYNTAVTNSIDFVLLSSSFRVVSMVKHIPVAPQSSRCATCMLGHVCLPVGLPPSESSQLDELVSERVRVEKGQALYTPGDSAKSIYAVRTGFLKLQIENESGDNQIIGFPMAGELLGLDGLMEGKHQSRAIALEDSELCIIRLEQVDDLARRLPTLHNQMRALLSRELSRSQRMLLSLGCATSERRLVGFLLNLSERLALLGYSPNEFLMRMSRAEIGNYLGMTLETVSRLFSRLARDGLIEVHQRSVKILNMQGLQQRLEHAEI